MAHFVQVIMLSVSEDIIEKSFNLVNIEKISKSV